MTRTDLIGRRFGRLKVLTYVGNDKHRRSQWQCRCDCGTERFFSSQHLINGRSSSCGCVLGYVPFKQIKHGFARRGNNALYAVWKGMIRRCTSFNDKHWNSYGGRGIGVCDAWKNIATFVRWSEANGWALDKELHRKNNDGNYEPDNCEWLSMDEHHRRHKRQKRSFDLISATLSFGM
jgi:hypothetical protein